ncbi:MAG: 30S ribosomal protein S17e [Candidatus Diapherotrites archaeon]|jgi:ribosomal protein S17E|uniref:30S ribosomal protein S17e n=1 Tax=Candidatus Iainarchaeum sp. TaxID=3101447 RepID=A0A7K4BYU4_9ARCH|nr:30S ribosomal protein S17e [Candidatus Diapherotrites archaeon]
MGKSVSKVLKYKGEVLLREFPEKFGKNFEQNKKELSLMELGLSKTTRNIVAGYIVRLAKRKEKEQLKK